MKSAFGKTLLHRRGKGSGLLAIVIMAAVAVAGIQLLHRSFAETAVTVPFRLNAGGPAYTDPQGNAWAADDYFSGQAHSYDTAGGAVTTVTSAITGTDNAVVFQTERWGMSDYHIPIANGTYQLKLDFAEINPSAGTRVMAVTAEGQPFVTNLNIEAEVGDYVADVKSGTVTVSDGSLDLAFTSSQGDTKINGIEILPASASPDIDGNGTVDVHDLAYLLGKWGSADTKADLDGSGAVDVHDLSKLLGAWGHVPSPSPTPVASPTPTASPVGQPGFSKGMVWQTDDMIAENGGNWDVNNANITAAITQDAVDMQAAGVSWVRLWTGPGGDTLASLTTVATIFKQHGIMMDFIVNSGHTSDAATEAGVKSWLASVVPGMAAMGEHYWEIGNEPNINYQAGGYWDTCPGTAPGTASGQGNTSSAVASYVLRLKDAYTAIHQSDSQAFVASAGLSYDPSYALYCEIPSYTWTAEFIKAQYGAWNYLDCIGIHPYDTSPGAVAGNVTNMRDSFYANTSFSGKPVCITEIGFWSNGYSNQTGGLGTSDENVRAADYTALMNDLKGVNVTTPVFWYTWYDFSQAQGYGIVHYNNFTSRNYLPIFNAVKNYTP